MNLLELSGQTPLVKITERVYAKLETYNPTGSVKDRVINYLVNDAIVAGKINSRTILCEATSGNTGIALSSAAASLGLPCYIYMPKNMSQERRTMMKLFGATIIDAPDSDFEAAMLMRDEFLVKNKNSWSPMQFSNPKNIICHQDTTAPEILNDIRTYNLGEWAAFVHGAGTGGTIEGIRQYVRHTKLDTRVCMVKPAESPHKIQGIADGKDFLASEADMDCVIQVPSDVAIKEAKTFCKETGLLVGISSGANIWAAKEYEKANPGSGIIVTMLCDRGERYLSIY